MYFKHYRMNGSHLRMHKLLAFMISLLVYICQTSGSEGKNSVSKADSKQQAVYPPYMYNPPMMYYYYPSPSPLEGGQQMDRSKPFGGDRSDRWLYPPRSYYVHWAEEEADNDWGNQWGQYRQRTARSMEPP